MKRLLILPVLLTFGGCASLASFQATFTKDVSAIETWVASVVAKVKADLPVVEADVQTAIGLICQANTIAQSNITGVQSSAQNASANVKVNLAAAAKYTSAASNSCASYNATQANQPTGSTATNLLVSIWNAYTAGKAAVAKATP